MPTKTKKAPKTFVFLRAGLVLMAIKLDSFSRFRETQPKARKNDS